MKQMTVSPGRRIKLKNYITDPEEYSLVSHYTQKELHDLSVGIMEDSQSKLKEAQDKLWACKKYGLLIVLQGMDTAGKDGTIKHVISGVNPQGCRVASFKEPTPREHAHDYLWRHYLELPARGEIVIFNRSHYENVLVTRVHPEYLEDLPEHLQYTGNKDFWKERYQDIVAFERHLYRNGTLILKFFLHISRDEQRRRLIDRLSNEDKYWKISTADLRERGHWDEYTRVYEEMLSNTSTGHAHWLIVPADDKKIARALVAYCIATAIGRLKMHYPEVTPARIKEIKKVREQLELEQYR